MATYWIENELDDFETRPQDKFIVTEETKNDLRSIFPFWKGRTLHDQMLTHMPESAREQLLMDHPAVFGWCAYQNGVGHISQGHENVIRKGFKKIREEAEHCRAGRSYKEDSVHKLRIITPDHSLTAAGARAFPLNLS